LTQLQELNLGGNGLTSLPPEIGQLTELQELDLRGNPLDIPDEVLSRWQDAPFILNFLKQKAFGERPLNEVKLLFVGEPEVGKTSLVEALVTNECQPDKRSTQGIDIKKWTIPIADDKEQTQNVQVNIWDFGGQEIMHHTHKFFLTARSLYLLIFNARHNSDQNRLEYWLDLVTTIAGSDVPLLLVANHIDELAGRAPDINEATLRSKHPNIKGILHTSCKPGALQGIDELRYAITDAIRSLEHVHAPIST
jgi:internalin A